MSVTHSVIPMTKHHHISRRGLSTIEMTIAATLLVIFMFGVSGVLSNNQQGWNSMYNQIYSNVVTEGHIAKRTFDAIVRQSSSDGMQIDTNGQWVEVSYYASDASTSLDRYARFFYLENQLFVERGQLNPRQTLSLNTVCSNVTNCIFKQSGDSVHMLLTLDDGYQNLTIGSSAKPHN